MAENNIETMELYPWQEKALADYQGKGVIKAVTGAGKSLVALKLAQQMHRNGYILVTAPRVSILDQWKIIMKDIIQ